MQMYASGVKKQLRGGWQGLLEHGVGVEEAVNSSVHKTKLFQPSAYSHKPFYNDRSRIINSS